MVDRPVFAFDRFFSDNLMTFYDIALDPTEHADPIKDDVPRRIILGKSHSFSKRSCAADHVEEAFQKKVGTSLNTIYSLDSIKLEPIYSIGSLALSGDSFQPYNYNAPSMSSLNEFNLPSLSSLISSGSVNVEAVTGDSSERNLEKTCKKPQTRKVTAAHRRFMEAMSKPPRSDGLNAPQSKPATSTVQKPRKPKKRIRRKEPAVRKFVIKTDQDVLLGRGGGSNRHIGNMIYRKKILELQPKYKELVRENKKVMSQSVVTWVYTRGGRFLKQAEKNAPYYVVTEATAREKVSQALREDHTPEGRHAKKARTKSKAK